MKSMIDRNVARTGILTSLMLAGFASDASAAPTIFPRPGNRLTEVVNTTPSVVLADSQDRNTIYVMPPASGKASLANASYSANVGFCAEVKDLQGYSRNLSGRINTAITELDRYGDELDVLRNEKAEFERQAAAIKASSQAVREADDLQDAIFDAQDRIDELREARRDCDDDTCLDSIDAEIEALKDEVASLKDELRAKRREAGDAIRQFERLEASAQAVQREIDDVFALIDTKAAFIAKGRDQIFALYRNLGKLEGGTAAIDFRLGWNDNVVTLRGANAGFNVVPVATSEARAMVSLVPGLGTDSYLESLPTVLNMSIAGTFFDPNNQTLALPAVPDITSVAVRLSLLGACAQKSPADFDIEKSAQGLPVYGLSETYVYPSTFRTNVTARVNLWKAYSYMKKVTTSGGFFSSRTRTQVSETTSGDSFVEVVTFDESGLSSEEVAALEGMIKMEAMNDVLRLMGVPQYTSGGGGLDVIPASESGALVLATGVDKTCGWLSYWCGGVSWVLRGLNAIFGSSNVEANFQQNYNFWANRSYSRDFVSNRPGLVTFER